MNQQVRDFFFISKLISELKHLKEYNCMIQHNYFLYYIIYGASLMAKSSKKLTRLQDFIHV